VENRKCLSEVDKVKTTIDFPPSTFELWRLLKGFTIVNLIRDIIEVEPHG
jgi:hypothetical protein